MRRASVFTGLLALGTVGPGIDELRAAENATGLYLLGVKTSMAGFVPPPGTYVMDINLYYSGSASGATPSASRCAAPAISASMPTSKCKPTHM